MINGKEQQDNYLLPQDKVENGRIPTEPNRARGPGPRPEPPQQGPRRRVHSLAQHKRIHAKIDQHKLINF